MNLLQRKFFIIKICAQRNKKQQVHYIDVYKNKIISKTMRFQKYCKTKFHITATIQFVVFITSGIQFSGIIHRIFR